MGVVGCRGLQSQPVRFLECSKAETIQRKEVKKKQIQPKRIAFVPIRQPHLYRAIKAEAALQEYRLTDFAAVLVEAGARHLGIYPTKEETNEHPSSHD
jgi:hypothetical protein